MLALPLRLTVMLGLLLMSSTGFALPLLQRLDFSTLPGDRLEFVLSLSETGVMTRDFETENPGRIILDLSGVSNRLEKKFYPVDRGGVVNVQAVEASGRTRIILNLSRMQPYAVKTQGNRVILTLGADSTAGNPVETGEVYRASPPLPAATTPEIGNVDFRRGERGEGRVLISLGNARGVVDIRREGKRIAVDLPGALLPARLSRRLDVIDFATPVHFIEGQSVAGGVKILITPVTDQFEFSSYQSGSLVAIDVRKGADFRKKLGADKPVVYSGNKLTLNFQDIPVRSVLQILADFTGANIVASDAVDGNVTLRLKDVPWDQALDLVLKAKGLGKRQEGNIIRVAPNEELMKQSLDQQDAEDADPLYTEIFQINYAKAEDIKSILYGTVSKDKITGEPGVAGTQTKERAGENIISSRGHITNDPRTNQLIIQDTSRNLERIRELIQQLDKPVKQVLIESRIVIATNDFMRELGAKLSFNRTSWANQQAMGIPQRTPNTTGTNQTTGEILGGNQWGNALTDLASAAAAGAGGYFGVTFLKVGEYLLDLELSAAQAEDRSEIVSTPKVVTADGAEAYILQGTQIPYSMTPVGSIASNVQFKDAVLELKVTPHITPDENILMDLRVKKDAPGKEEPNGNRAIEKREIQTSAQVSNGETMVLGGVFEGNQENKTDKVPFLGDLPGIGFMFRRDKVVDKKVELLIFITPKIIDSRLSGK